MSDPRLSWASPEDQARLAWTTKLSPAEIEKELLRRMNTALAAGQQAAQKEREEFNQKLIDTVEASLQEGLSAKDLVQKLIDGGWVSLEDECPFDCDNCRS
jgi:hypothetical protein